MSKESPSNSFLSAVQSGQYDKVKQILEKDPKTISINFRSGLKDAFKKVPLHEAIKGNYKMVELLIASGADYDMINEENCSPLQLALLVDNINFEIVNLLLDCGAILHKTTTQGHNVLNDPVNPALRKILPIGVKSELETRKRIVKRIGTIELLHKHLTELLEEKNANKDGIASLLEGFVLQQKGSPEASSIIQSVINSELVIAGTTYKGLADFAFQKRDPEMLEYVLNGTNRGRTDISRSVCVNPKAKIKEYAFEPTVKEKLHAKEEDKKGFFSSSKPSGKDKELRDAMIKSIQKSDDRHHRHYEEDSLPSDAVITEAMGIVRELVYKTKNLPDLKSPSLSSSSSSSSPSLSSTTLSQSSPSTPLIQITPPSSARATPETSGRRVSGEDKLQPLNLPKRRSLTALTGDGTPTPSSQLESVERSFSDLVTPGTSSRRSSFVPTPPETPDPLLLKRLEASGAINLLGGSPSGSPSPSGARRASQSTEKEPERP